MKKNIRILLYIFLIVLISSTAFGHNLKKHKPKKILTTTSTVTTSSTITTANALTTMTAIISPTAEEIKLAEKIKKDEEFRKSLVPSVMTGNVLVLMLAFWVIVSDRRKRKKTS